MRKLSEFKSVTDLPFNEDILIDIYSGIHAEAQILETLNRIAKPLGGEAVLIAGTSTMERSVRMNVPEENILKPEPEPTTFDFSQALKELKEGKKVTRKPGEGQKSANLYIEMLKAELLYRKKEVLIKTNGADAEVWFPTHNDLFASDWMIVEP